MVKGQWGRGDRLLIGGTEEFLERQRWVVNLAHRYMVRCCPDGFRLMTSVSQKEKEELSIPLWPQRSDLCSEAYYRFLRRHHTVFDFFFFALHLATRMDEQRLIAARALAKGGAAEDKKRLEEAEANKDSIFSKLQGFGEYQSEIMCIRIVDNFLCFVSETIQTCMMKQPNMLKSSEQMKIEDVLKFSRKADIVRFLVDRKINDISYGGIAEITKFLNSRTGINLTDTDNENDLLNIAVELRNIYTHNRGLVNEMFLRRIGSANSIIKAKAGKRKHADYDLIVDLSNNLFHIARRLDQQISAKFRIRRKQYGTWERLKNPEKPKTGDAADDV